MTRLLRTTSLTTLALTGALVLGGCSPDYKDEQPGPVVDRGIDAREYVEDYEQAEFEDQSGSDSTQYSASAPTAGEGESAEPGLLDDNVFVDHGASGFVDADEDARSTFALDVDTGSYSVARTLLDQGRRPPPASIRVEEWVNAFGYGDEAPTDADLAVTAETGTAPSLDDGTQLVRVAVTSRELSQAERPRLNVALVVDRSGSMDIRERLGLVKSSLALLANGLRDDDVVSVVSFEDQARPILEPTPVEDTDAVLDAIDELRPGGSTNLEAGLRLGYEQARESFIEDGANVVVLCSDGVANVGRTGPGSIVDKIQDEGADGIHLVTVGYGMGNYNDHLMEQLADLGDGFYSYVDTFEEAESLFGTELVTTMVPVAAEARAQVSFDPELVESYRLVGYDNRTLADEDFDDLSVDAGELGPGHRATALYEVRLADGVPSGSTIGTAQLAWLSAGDGEEQQAQVDVTSASGHGSPSASFDLAATVADTAELLKGGDPVAERGVALADLTDRAEALAQARVPGAEELLERIRAIARG
ncbi:von Willebrand factor type A domain-containing protein [Nocardioides sp.]|uniref:vWA domain-containing protein n=1 Tax=Nocardioides sp. TaxID=35761 RepID=UPI001A2A142E|nr:von Willebrand factor type A domain-containing protein [Nocardioides sp.]MBJ7355799.1 von Willebrand factor type A domain-containing protein [Nocardioides sp.]